MRRARSSKPAGGLVTAPATPISHEQRQELIARLAYLRAERRGFGPGHELDDWLEAEAEIDASIGARRARG